jgi:hypothetical protein
MRRGSHHKRESIKKMHESQQRVQKLLSELDRKANRSRKLGRRKEKEKE